VAGRGHGELPELLGEGHLPDEPIDSIRGGLSHGQWASRQRAVFIDRVPQGERDVTDNGGIVQLLKWLA
jgi:hypothetical protein